MLPRPQTTVGQILVEPPPPPLPGDDTPAWKRMFRAFKHHNFRLYFFGLLISILGTWTQDVAQGWLVYELTQSSLALGQVSFMLALPVILIGPWAGVIIDRVEKRKLLMITQTVLMSQAVVLAVMTFTGHVEMWLIMAMALVRGLGNAFDAPTRQSFIVEMVGKEDLPNGIALNSTMFSLARMFGPAIGGLIVATFGTAWGFTVNAASFLSILISLMLITSTIAAPVNGRKSPLGDLMEGLRYIGSQRHILALMALALSIALFGANFGVLMPVFAAEILGQSVQEYGLLQGAVGVGSLIGALAVTYFSTLPGRGRKLNIVNFLFPLALTLFSFTRTFPLALLALAPVGAMFIPQLSLCNMLIQSNIPDGIRGRVMSVYTLLIFGGFPLGGLFAGAIAEQVGVPITLLINAGVLLTVGIIVRLMAPEIITLE